MTDTTDEDDEIEIEIERTERVESDGDDRNAVDPPPRTGREWSAGSSSSAGSSAEYTDTESSPERRLEDELGRIDISSTSEGYVEGRVTGLESVDETTVRLDASLPHGESVTFTLDKPIPWSEEFLLARIVEDVGYEASSIGHLVGERVYLARADLERESSDEDGDDWWSWPSSAHADGWETLVSSLTGGRYRLERDVEPAWRLVDPRERRTDEDAADRLTDDAATLGVLLLALAPLVVAVGVTYGLTGGVTVSATIVGVALLGVALSLLGATALVRGDE